MNFSIKMAKCSREQPSGNDVRRPRSLLPPLPDVRAADDAGAPQPALWQGRQDHGEIPVKDRYLRTWAVALFHNSVWHNYVLSLQFSLFNLWTHEAHSPYDSLDKHSVTFLSARYCFVENLHATGKMSDAEHAVISEWFDYLVSCPQLDIDVDLVVYLR